MKKIALTNLLFVSLQPFLFVLSPAKNINRGINMILLGMLFGMTGNPFSNLEVKRIETDIIIGESVYYEFHSNYWLNMHQFLYQQAKRNQLPNIENINDEERIALLEDGEREVFNNAVEYYKANVIQHHLLFSGAMSELRVFFHKQDMINVNEHPLGEEYDMIFKHLNEFSEIYERNFWPAHHQKNKEFLDEKIDLLKELETAIVPKLTELSQADWPEGKVRVDLSVYANGVGAYTATRPKPNVVISSADKTNKGFYFHEIVFHESSHLLFPSEGPWREKISNRSKELGIEPPRNLWHSSLFYLSGKTVQDELAKKGIEHEMYMVKNNVFSRHNNEGFREALDLYYKNQISLDETIDKLLH